MYRPILPIETIVRPPGEYWVAINKDSGEIVECRSLAVLLRHHAVTTAHPGQLEIHLGRR